MKENAVVLHDDKKYLKNYLFVYFPRCFWCYLVVIVSGGIFICFIVHSFVCFRYYPTAEEVYGKDVEILVEGEDAQPLTEPILQPIKVKSIQLTEKATPATAYSSGLFQFNMNFHTQALILIKKLYFLLKKAFFFSFLIFLMYLFI